MKYTHKIKFNIITVNGDKLYYEKFTSFGAANRFRTQLEMNPLVRNIEESKILEVFK